MDTAVSWGDIFEFDFAKTRRFFFVYIIITRVRHNYMNFFLVELCLLPAVMPTSRLDLQCFPSSKPSLNDS